MQTHSKLSPDLVETQQQLMLLGHDNVYWSKAGLNNVLVLLVRLTLKRPEIVVEKLAKPNNKFL